jgi:hypothetical protein
MIGRREALSIDAPGRVRKQAFPGRDPWQPSIQPPNPQAATTKGHR